MSTETSKNTSLNDQIADSISAMQHLITSSSDEGITLMTYQIMAQATGLAMLNAVNQQQQMYILHNAVTAATAKAALDSKPEEAIKIINEAMNNSNILETFNGLKNFMDELTKTYNALKEKMAMKEETPEGNSH
ncbi:MAG: RebB family R body protein [Methylococcaceae bacterium]|jgi:hypothetical protein